jgi:ABC-type Fe3+/spermidine/putrescine transport system ATPase subunit
MATGGARVEIEDLSVGYDRTPVLDGLDLDIRPGAFVALLGASGCGKTTLLRAMSGFLPISAGRILIDGTDVTEAPPERRPSAMVFQSYALWPHMSVAANIGYGLKLRRLGRAAIAARVAEVLDLLDLSGFADRRPTALSGGQRQRVALGRAIAIDPPLLLLDEPLSNLDAKIRHTMRAEIRALQRRLGLTAILVTHDQEEAMVMADRILVMDRGRIVRDGAPEEVWRRPGSAFVARFLGADNAIAARAEIEGGSVVVAVPDGPRVRPPVGTPFEGPCAVHFRSAAVGFDRGAAEVLRFPGRIRTAAYPGGRHRYEVETPFGLFAVEETRRAAPGEAVVLAVPLDELHTFPTAAAPVPIDRADGGERNPGRPAP